MCVDVRFRILDIYSLFFFENLRFLRFPAFRLKVDVSSSSRLPVIIHLSLIASFLHIPSPPKLYLLFGISL